MKFETIRPFELLANMLGNEAIRRGSVLRARRPPADGVGVPGMSKEPTGSFGSTQDKRRRYQNLRFDALEVPDNRITTQTWRL
jgi:hypothetical protein